MRKSFFTITGVFIFLQLMLLNLTAANKVSEELINNPFANEIELEQLISEKFSENNAPWLSLIKGAILSYKVKDYAVAEQQFLNALNIDMPTEIKKSVIQNLCRIYEVIGDVAREILMYEKYLELFDDTYSIPYVILKLGSLYTKSGAHEMAINRYYSVLNRAFVIPLEFLDEYRDAIVYAQIKIANAYTEIGNYTKALELIDKIQTNVIPDNDLTNVLFMKGLCAYETKKFEDAIPILENFKITYSEDINTPKTCYILVQCYKELKNIDKVNQTIQFILQEGKRKRNSNDKIGQLWHFWQKKTAEEVAQDFYEKNQFADALKIYQIMVQMDDSIEWQWPLLYSIGLCYERMQMLSRSRAAYELIANSQTLEPLTPILLDYKKEAYWKIQQLNTFEQNKLNSITL